MRFLYFFLIGFIPLLEAQEVCLFTPPKDWLPAEPEKHSSLVKIGFIDPKGAAFHASINLAEEEIDCTEEEYLDAVKKIHLSSRKNTWAYLGKIPTNSGEAFLMQIETTAPSHPIRMLQLILFHDRKAYILTGAATKKDFSKFLTLFKNSFSSLTLTSDLLSLLSNEEDCLRISSLKDQVKNGEKTAWKAFELAVLELKNSPGPYWKALLLAETSQKTENTCCK